MSPKMRNKLSRRKNIPRPTALDESLEDFAEPVVKKSSQRSASIKSQPAESAPVATEKVSQDKPEKKTAAVSKLVSNGAVDEGEVFKEVTNVVKKADKEDPNSGSVSSMANCPFCGKEFKSSSEVRSGNYATHFFSLTV